MRESEQKEGQGRRGREDSEGMRSQGAYRDRAIGELEHALARNLSELPPKIRTVDAEARGGKRREPKSADKKGQRRDVRRREVEADYVLQRRLC